MSNTKRKFEVTDDKFVPKIPGPRPPLPRMMTAKPVKLKTIPKDEEKSSDTNDLEDSCHSDSQDKDKTDDEPNNSLSSHKSHSLKISKKFNDETQNIKKNIIKEPKVVRNIFHNQSSTQKQSDFKRNYLFNMSIVAVILVIIAYSFALLPIDNSTKKSTEDQQFKNMIMRNLKNNIDSISNKFKQQDIKIWNDIISEISEVVNYPDKLSIIFLFSHDDIVMSCLAKMIGNASKAALGSSEELLLSPLQLGNDSGNVIDKYQNQIEKQKIVIVDNLLNVNPDAMMAFHHLCDRHTPLVKKVVYILTMVAEGYDEKNEQAMKFVENQLEFKLRDQINPDKVNPLITRMTDGLLIPVRPELDFKSCPLRY